jgi:hypothetical protein
MERISLNWWYNLSTPSLDGGGNVSRSAAIVAMFWIALVNAERWPPLVADGRRHSLGLSSGGGEVHR